MPLSINFRWKTPVVNVSNAEQASRTQGIKDLAAGIGTAIQNRRYRNETERRNRIEDEDRTRRIDEEDRRKQAYSEVADIMRNRKETLDRLHSERASVMEQIRRLQDELGE